MQGLGRREEERCPGFGRVSIHQVQTCFHRFAWGLADNKAAARFLCPPCLRFRSGSPNRRHRKARINHLRVRHSNFMGTLGQRPWRPCLHPRKPAFNRGLEKTMRSHRNNQSRDLCKHCLECGSLIWASNLRHHQATAEPGRAEQLARTPRWVVHGILALEFDSAEQRSICMRSLSGSLFCDRRTEAQG